MARVCCREPRAFVCRKRTFCHASGLPQTSVNDLIVWKVGDGRINEKQYQEGNKKNAAALHSTQLEAIFQ